MSSNNKVTVTDSSHTSFGFCYFTANQNCSAIFILMLLAEIQINFFAHVWYRDNAWMKWLGCAINFRFFSVLSLVLMREFIGPLVHTSPVQIDKNKHIAPITNHDQRALVRTRFHQLFPSWGARIAMQNKNRTSRIYGKHTTKNLDGVCLSGSHLSQKLCFRRLVPIYITLWCMWV